MAQNPEPRRRVGANIPSAGQYGSIGLQFGVGLVVFTLAGNWLDRRLGTGPWLLLVGVMLGFALSATWIYRQLVIKPRERAKREERS